MAHAKHIEERLKEPENSIEHWREQVAEHGIEHVKKLIDDNELVSVVWPISAERAVEEREKELYKQSVEQSLQYKEKLSRQEARAEEGLETAKQANNIAKGANTLSTLAIIISVVAIFVSVLVAIGQNSG